MDVLGAIPARARLRLLSTVALALFASILLAGAPVFFSMSIDLFAAPEQRSEALLLITASAVVLAGGKFLLEQRWLVYKPVEVLLLNALRAAYLRHVLLLPIAFHLNRSIGRLDSIRAQGVAGVQFLSGGVFTQAALRLFEIAATIIGTAAVLSLELAGIMAVTLTLYLVVLVRRTGNVTRQWGVAISASADAQTQATDAILNVKTLAAEGTVLGCYEHTFSKAVRVYAQYYHSLGIFGLGPTSILIAGFGAALTITTQSVIAGDLTLGHLVVMNAYILQVFWPIESFGSYYRDARHSFTKVVRLIDQLSVKPDVDPAIEAMPTALRRIVVDSVRFSYGDRRPTLAIPSTVIEHGKMSAVLGESGSGKSTLVRLLVKLYPLASGRIETDGRPIATINGRSLRENIALVPQDPVMFDASLAFNIAMSNAHDPRRLAAAISDGELAQLVEKLPDGVHIEIGERGLKLSGGERQRVAITTALYRSAQVLILDEATSALDEIITHDPAVAEIADRVTMMASSSRYIDANAAPRPPMSKARGRTSPGEIAAA